jgi:formate hydrogenlyase subunit 4
MPVDDPKTHLELTMVHEVMILDHSGFDLALMHIGTALKFSIYGLLIANFLVPVDGVHLISDTGMRITGRSHGIVNLGTSGRIRLSQVGVYFILQFMFAALIGLMESFRARKKLVRNPQFIVTLSSIALVAFILVLLITFKMVR